MGKSRSFCDRLPRRDMLRMGMAGFLGGSLSLEQMLQGQAQAAERGVADKGVSVIYLFLKGGLSTIDTFDMKPSAPAEFRGEFDPISTNTPGLQICEHLPLLAKQMDKFSLIRSFGHSNSGHGPADHYMLTGYLPTAGFNANISPNNQRPAHGAVISRKLGASGSVPPYVCLPSVHKSAGPAYLGAAHAPLAINADPNAPDFVVPDIIPPLNIQARRITARRALLKQVDRFERSAESKVNQSAKTVSVFRKKAFDLMTSKAAKKAFNIHSEPDKLRDRYGRNTLGQSCLMARRMVEAGVRCVTIDHSNWDTHDNNFTILKRELLPSLDSGMSMLFEDLSDRGMLEKTLVIVTGEFGRTPRINKNAGRDHWGPSFTVAMAGGGVQGGRAIGTSDARAERPDQDPYGPEDLAATMYHLLGIDYNQEFYTAEGRPVKIANEGRVIRPLI